jgi:hypothetical protein
VSLPVLRGDNALLNRLQDSWSGILNPVLEWFGKKISSTGAFLGDVATEAWTAPRLAGAWVNFGGGTVAAGYCRDAVGFVHLRGTVKSGTSTIFTLPSNYRPAAIVSIVSIANDAAVKVVILTTGEVQLASGTASSYLALDGIIFDTRS